MKFALDFMLSDDGVQVVLCGESCAQYECEWGFTESGFTLV